MTSRTPCVSEGQGIYNGDQLEAAFVLEELCWGRVRACRTCGAPKSFGDGVHQGCDSGTFQTPARCTYWKEAQRSVLAQNLEMATPTQDTIQRANSSQMWYNLI